MYCLQNTVELAAKRYAIEPTIANIYALGFGMQISRWWSCGSRLNTDAR
jgi:hypothetical protein